MRLSLDLADYSHPVLDRPLATKHAWRATIEQAASGTVRGGTKLTMSAELMAETVRTIVELRNPHLDTEGLDSKWRRTRNPPLPLPRTTRGKLSALGIGAGTVAR